MKTIQIRNVPEDLHRTLTSRAALAGMSLSDYLLNDNKHQAELPTMQEMRERLLSQSPVKLSLSPADAVRQERGPLGPYPGQTQS